MLYLHFYINYNFATIKSKSQIKMKIFLTSLFFTVAFIASDLKAQFGGGAGTEESPYLIYTKEHLSELADSVNGGYDWSKNLFFHLMNDITDSVRTVIGLGPTFRSEEFVCLLRRSTQRTTWDRLKNYVKKEVKDSSLAHSFQGYFNGRGHKITLAINMPTENNVGLFGCVSGDGLILDLDVDGYVIGYSRVGGFVGYVRMSFASKSFYMFSELNNNATITSTDGKVTSAGGIIGVAVGNKNNTIFIDRCRNNALINDKTYFPEEPKGLVGSFGRKDLKVNFRSIYQ